MVKYLNAFTLEISQLWKCFDFPFTNSFHTHTHKYTPPKKFSTQNHKTYMRFVITFGQVCNFPWTEKCSLYLHWDRWRTGGRKGGKGKRKNNKEKKGFTHKRKILFEFKNILLNYWYHINLNKTWNCYLSKSISTVFPGCYFSVMNSNQ